MSPRLSNGTSVQIEGTWKASPARGQPYELIAEVVQVFGTTDTEVSAREELC
jgi:aspartyl/asparaginyl-tRNA synthetase